MGWFLLSQWPWNEIINEQLWHKPKWLKPPRSCQRLTGTFTHRLPSPAAGRYLWWTSSGFTVRHYRPTPSDTCKLVTPHKTTTFQSSFSADTSPVRLPLHGIFRPLVVLRPPVRSQRLCDQPPPLRTRLPVPTFNNKTMTGRIWWRLPVNTHQNKTTKVWNEPLHHNWSLFNIKLFRI